MNNLAGGRGNGLCLGCSDTGPGSGEVNFSLLNSLGRDRADGSGHNIGFVQFRRGCGDGQFGDWWLSAAVESAAVDVITGCWLNEVWISFPAASRSAFTSLSGS